MDTAFELLRASLRDVTPLLRIGRIAELSRQTAVVTGLSGDARIGDSVRIRARDGWCGRGEVIRLAGRHATVLPEEPTNGAAIGDPVELQPDPPLAPCTAWIGRVIDPDATPLDGRPLPRGSTPRPQRALPPPAGGRRRLGPRLETGLALFDTLLPIVRGQRVGLFAGSGVGKSTLIGQLATGIAADVVVIALIGERGRELREMIDRVLGPEQMRRSIIVAATADRSPLVRRRAAWTAMAICEHFRDQGLHVLLLMDSITRFAEAHREVALASGEDASLGGYPPSTAHLVSALAERAGPGLEGTGDITAVLSVLVPGSDMEEPLADILRGVLDGHVVLDRAIAEAGRFPAVDVLRSVSRSLPEAADAVEHALILRARQVLGVWAGARSMVQAGLYRDGADPEIDAARRIVPELEVFLTRSDRLPVTERFAELSRLLNP